MRQTLLVLKSLSNIRQFAWALARGTSKERKLFAWEENVSCPRRADGFFSSPDCWSCASISVQKAVIGGFLVPCLMDGEFEIHIFGLPFKNATVNVNCTFNYGVPFSANITSAAHHSLHFKLPTTTADRSLTLSSSLTATLCFVTWLWVPCVSSQTRMTVALSNVNLVFICSIFETAIR